MDMSLRRALRKGAHEGLRAALALLPRETRFRLLRRLVDCEPEPDPRLQVHIAQTREELEACFGLLHDAYVGSGFMRPHPSGLRVTPYHALPTTTTLAATYDGEVVGTLSLIRDGIFGFPMQRSFDLSAVRAQPGHVAEVSALAVHPRWRKTGGTVLFPLMKFMYEYCTEFFDTRHLVIAVNPNKIALYEALLMFKRLEAAHVDRYDFANGAPAVGAALDLHGVAERMARLYAGAPLRRDLHGYFITRRLPNLEYPERRYFTTNDPVMTPALLDHFFNQRTNTFETLDARQRVLLHAIYADPDYREVLPPLAAGEATERVRRHARHALKCPGTLRLAGTEGLRAVLLTEISRGGCKLLVDGPLARGDAGRLSVHLGRGLVSDVPASVARVLPQAGGGHACALHVQAPDAAWLQCLEAIEKSRTHAELQRAPAPPPRNLPTPALALAPA